MGPTPLLTVLASLSLNSAFFGVDSCSVQLVEGLEEGDIRANHLHVPEQMLLSWHTEEIRVFNIKYFLTLILKIFKCKAKLKEQYNRRLLTFDLD